MLGSGLHFPYPAHGFLLHALNILAVLICRYDNRPPRLSLDALRALGSSFSFALVPAQMAVIFLQHLPRLSLDALRALGSSFSFALTPTQMAVIFFATSSQAEPGRTTRSGLKFFFSLTPAQMAGFLQLPLRLSLRRRRLDPRYEARTVRTGFMKIRNRRNAPLCRLSKN
ncbi:hypothetical protein CLOLEP_01050 [[Clostridium] leptum DSM 753]|uniref:Uncharacterized protein n=1 Tax=[Clostridium] leptum DSM 753 TaxID=428125 RepID=A7VR67_9FIRM|nr:hypothetical protein CLOLEP_01050 [[Clostridium] leptum DSM 753]PEQ24996.1 hypothetical protein CH238_06010 [[Clostridium] leptum DSM 753]